MGCQQAKKSGIFLAILVILLGLIAAGIPTYLILQKEEIEPIKKFSKPTKKPEESNQTTTTTLTTSATTSTTTEYIIDTTTVSAEVSLCAVSNTWSGDGFCDDEGNIVECNFDNGDCCLPFINNLYCLECFCYQDNSQHGIYETTTATDNTYTTCSSSMLEYIGDGYCDDSANIPVCNFDQGDCCLEPIQDQYCIECQCVEFNITDCPTDLYYLVNDGVCQDISNIEECAWDGGDCCQLLPISLLNCYDCECHLDPDLNLQPCHKTNFQGNGICDDDLNTFQCEFDHGDCCLTNDTHPGVFDTCIECICHGCPYEIEMVGDGYCDDSTNNAMCNYDGGDCCLQGEEANWSACEFCTCHDQSESTISMLNSTEFVSLMDITEH